MAKSPRTQRSPPAAESPSRQAVGRDATEAPFVGRAAQLTALVGALDMAIAAGSPRYVLVEGAAGIGKSRLVREFPGVARDRASAVAVLQARGPRRGAPTGLRDRPPT